jgi:uncharacterized membrane protein
LRAYIVANSLVLDISVPQISSHSTVGGDVIAGTELFKKLYDLWPKILSFGISFLISAIYWMAHHRQFHYIKHSSYWFLTSGWDDTSKAL